jgi:hypothetical protein
MALEEGLIENALFLDDSDFLTAMGSKVFTKNAKNQ